MSVDDIKFLALVARNLKESKVLGQGSDIKYIRIAVGYRDHVCQRIQEIIDAEVSAAIPRP